MSILPQLEQDLYRAAEQRLATEPTRNVTRADHRRGLDSTRRWEGLRRRLSTTASTVPILLAVAATGIIAAFALTLSHGGRRPSTAEKPASSVQVTRQQLIGMLGVLRRPPIKADLNPENELEWHSTKLPGRLARRLGDPKLDRALVRLVGISAWHAKVEIQAATWQPSPSSPQRSEGIDLDLRIETKPTIPPSSDTGSGPEPTSASTIRDHGLALTSSAPGGQLIDGILLVPDGVARITLRVNRIIHDPVKVDPSQFDAASATVHDNIAAFQLTLPTIARPTGASGVFGTDAVAQTTWFDASGHALKHTATSVPVFVKLIGEKPTQRRPQGLQRRRVGSGGCQSAAYAC